jgi:hypothetical protein
MVQLIRIGIVGPSQADDSFGQVEQLVWTAQTLSARAGTNHVIWHLCSGRCPTVPAFGEDGVGHSG